MQAINDLADTSQAHERFAGTHRVQLPLYTSTHASYHPTTRDHVGSGSLPPISYMNRARFWIDFR